MKQDYLHHIPGRIRIRTRLLKRNATRGLALEELLASFSGIRSIELNALTGSATLRYSPQEVEGAQIIEALATAGYIDPSRAISSDYYLDVAASRAGRAMADVAAGAVLDWLVGRGSLGVLAAII
jgi:hypothetical protein